MNWNLFFDDLRLMIVSSFVLIIWCIFLVGLVVYV
jgi:hypothetical protein